MTIQKMKQTIFRSVAGILAALVLSFGLSPLAFAADYNCGAYGAGEFGNGQTCAAATDDGGSGLVNTGQKVLAFGIPAVMIIAGTVILFKVRKKKPEEPSNPAP